MKKEEFAIKYEHKVRKNKLENERKVKTNEVTETSGQKVNPHEHIVKYPAYVFNNSSEYLTERADANVRQ